MRDNLKIYLSDLSSSNRKVSLKKDKDVVNESSIWKNFKMDDESAFVYIYDTYYRVLFNLGLYITKDEDLIKDTIHDLFVDIRINRKKLADVRSIKAYLIVSFRRKLIKYIFEEEQKVNAILKIAKETFEVYISPEDPVETIYDNELKKGFELLSRKEKEGIYYFYYENLSYNEIKDLFNYSQVKTARNLIYQALDKLRSFMMSLVIIIFILMI